MPFLKMYEGGDGLTPFQAHYRKWKDCTGCGLCKTRRKVVLARGTIPCDVLFIGEGPGESENNLGIPFIGPAGKLLDRVILRAMSYDPKTKKPRWTFAFTNMVACIPRNPDKGGKADEPLPEEIRACMGRLQEMISLAKPRLIVAVGGLARDWMDHKRRDHVPLPKRCGNRIPVVDVIHPAAILRANVAQRSFLIQRSIVTIENAVRDYLAAQGTEEGLLDRPSE